MLYKYRSFESEYFEDFFVNKRIYFSKPDELNDPFECKPHVEIPTGQAELHHLANNWLNAQGITKLEDRKRHTAYIMHNLSNPEEAINRLHDMLSNYGLFCFASSPASILMWSHYASDHTGFCIEFNLSSDYHMIHLGPYFKVNYQEHYPAFNIDLLFDNELEALEEYNKMSLLTKSKISQLLQSSEIF